VSDDSALQVSYIDDYIFIIADQDNRSVSNLSVYAAGIPYTFLVKGSKTIFSTISVNLKSVELKKYKDVGIKGEFTNWAVDGTLETPINSVFLFHYPLKPGKYQYKLVADGKEIDDPSNPIKISNVIGGFNNVLEVKGPNKDQLPKITTDSFTQTEIIISSEKTDGVYAYWNNFRIEAKKEGDKLKLLIPPLAKYEAQSHIRIYD
jgi:hypothetical protein